jgi:biotin carboxyl carrier protein
MKKLVVILVVLIAIGAGAGAYYMRRGDTEPQVSTAQLTRGDVVDAVAATGTLEAVETVDVGTQVSGTVKELYADFNSIVRRGQVIARLDPSLIQTQVEQNRANVTRAEAELDRLRVGLADAKQKYERAQQMWAKNLIPRTDLETTEVNVKSAEAQIRSAQAALTQARANLNQQEVNLQHTVIQAPIDGIVIARNVDVGQTVAASMQAPTLYILAADLTKMQVLANIDEADVGAGRHVPRRRLPYRHVHWHGAAGPPAARRRAERRHLLHRDLRSEPAAQAEARDDREREHRDREADERPARAERRAAFPSDDGHLCRAQPAGAARVRADAGGPRRTRPGGRGRRRWSAGTGTIGGGSRHVRARSSGNTAGRCCGGARHTRNVGSRSAASA